MSDATRPWFQNVFYSITIVITVCTIVLGAYWNIIQTLNAQQVAMAGFEARLVISEKSLQNRADQDERFASEMRAALTEINKGVNALQVAEAKRR
jgi:hypothetical protein